MKSLKYKGLGRRILIFNEMGSDQGNRMILQSKAVNIACIFGLEWRFYPRKWWFKS